MATERVLCGRGQALGDLNYLSDLRLMVTPCVVSVARAHSDACVEHDASVAWHKVLQTLPRTRFTILEGFSWV